MVHAEFCEQLRNCRILLVFRQRKESLHYLRLGAGIT
jgi:hypothetical protein